VGLNGSGKSNVLEVLSEVFFYLETYHLDLEEKYQKANRTFGFEIEYFLPITEKNYIERLDGGFDVRETSWRPVRIRKTLKRKPRFFIIYEGAEIEISEPEETERLLPIRVIGYTSGQNEVISNPFIKIGFYYHEEFEKIIKGESIRPLDLDRLFFMDWDSNAGILLANYLIGDRQFQNSESGEVRTILDPLNTLLKVKDVHSFRIVLRYKQLFVDEENPDASDSNAFEPIYQELDLPSELERRIGNLKRCATTYMESGEGVDKVLTMDFFVDSECKRAFQEFFSDSFDLYKTFYLLRLLNIHMVRPQNRQDVLTTSSGSKFNISDYLPRFTPDQTIFQISNLLLRKGGEEKPIPYKHLSDGEHQLMHILGTVLLMNEPGSLFILDEPETHFNPEWKSKLIRTIRDLLDTQTLINEENKNRRNQQEIFVTTHSPFLVSDCKREDVFIFSRNQENGDVEYVHPKGKTFGTSVGILLNEIFGKSETIGDLAHLDIELLKDQAKAATTPEELDRIRLKAQHYGESVEKFLLLDLISRKKKRSTETDNDA
jgi:restriction system-associated AAA family ATPase